MKTPTHQQVKAFARQWCKTNKIVLMAGTQWCEQRGREGGQCYDCPHGNVCVDYLSACRNEFN